MDVQGRQVEVAVQKDGRVIGTANATLNLDRTLRTVLGFARRDQGEIPFALDRQGALYTPEPGDKAQLVTLGADRTAAVAAAGTPRRSGDWIVVARKATKRHHLRHRPARRRTHCARSGGRRYAISALGLLVIALAFIGIVPISHRMTQHLTTLTRGVRQLSGGDFRTRVPVRSTDEFGALAGAFNQMAEDLERHEALRRSSRSGCAGSWSCRGGSRPRCCRARRCAPAPRKSRGVSIPAREVGGDFFNYFVLPDGRLALLVGDVSGKGVSAALLMANIQATLRARLPHETDLAQLADRLDRELDQNTPGEVYLTLFLAILELDGRTLRYVNAGHNPQFLLRVGGGTRAARLYRNADRAVRGARLFRSTRRAEPGRPALLLHGRTRRNRERER